MYCIFNLNVNPQASHLKTNKARKKQGGKKQFETNSLNTGDYYVCFPSSDPNIALLYEVFINLASADWYQDSWKRNDFSDAETGCRSHLTSLKALQVFLRANSILCKGSCFLTIFCTWTQNETVMALNTTKLNYFLFKMFEEMLEDL